MQKRYCLATAFFTLLTIAGGAQTTYTPFGGKEQWLLDRLEIKLQANNDFNLSTVKPYMRKVYVRQAEMIDSAMAAGSNPSGFSKVDQYNIDRFLANNAEYALYQKESWKSKKPIGPFYTSKGNLLEVNQKDFYLSVNPAISQQQSVQTEMDGMRPFVNAKGVTARGLIANKIGFSFYATDNQERGPVYFQNRVRQFNAVPGVGFYKNFKTNAFDYYDFRGSATWNVTKYINMQFGYDKNFIGNGYRSLFLSDFSNSYLFLKLNTRIWKINYTNIFAELYPAFKSNPGDNRLPRKYMTLHHFSINATKWLNVGVLESVIFGRTDHYEFSYLLPVIFLRGLEGNNGSPDNANIGIDAKANIAKKIQVYGQVMFDEFKLDEIKAHNGWWANKQAVQLGAKYVDAFGIRNLDLQAEYNSIRPFTYAHRDSVAGYNHYNQPLAHPLGANVREAIGIARYQPLNRLYLTAKIIAWEQGLDSAGYNFGSNTLVPYEQQGLSGSNPRIRDRFYFIGSGTKVRAVNASFTASYEIKENLFIDGSFLYRPYHYVAQPANNTTATLFSIGLRWNIFRREYDY